MVWLLGYIFIGISLDRLLIQVNELQNSDIQNTISTFFSRCGIPYPTTILADVEFESACWEHAMQRAYPLHELGPFMEVGISIAMQAYSHLPNEEAKIFIALYTAFMSYLDDSCRDEKGVQRIRAFVERFSQNQPHKDEVLDNFASFLRDVFRHWKPLIATMILTATLNFFNSLVLDYETRTLKIDSLAHGYPGLMGWMSGVPVAYGMFAFPAEIPIEAHIQALSEIGDFTNYANDILSFYKEECDGESSNHISVVAMLRGLPKTIALALLAEETAAAHNRALHILKPHPEAYDAYEKYSHGYVQFHTTSSRYRLHELKL
ncbi:isoprenoid synthase domain-containing protein [Crucibulum laeve]|uniref:Isoprenoid synthase domain-containing protein n=1 Tax=Crucibulum laeve TaxID=68775 RepID=A0A5C3M2I8_9AGAR|nr:isoprenoid synthase domain-containing protein [Crucibulum laeve]